MPLEASHGTLRRHQLLGLTPAGWEQALAQAGNDAARDCIVHWAAQSLPLVLARQDPAAPPDTPPDALPAAPPVAPAIRLSLGLPAPACWGRQRLRLQIGRAEIVPVGAFPAAAEVTALLPPPLQPAWLALCAGLAALGLQPRVFGSHGWQQLSGLAYLRPGSDLDLLLPVDGPAQADAAAALLRDAPWASPRLDGELVFADGSAVAWREWLDWRGQRCDQILVKRLAGVALAAGPAWLDSATLHRPRPCLP